MTLPRYIINFDELTTPLKEKLLQSIENETTSKYSELNINNIQLLLENIKCILPREEYIGLQKKIQTFVNCNYEGNQKVMGKILDIPPIKKETKSDFKFKKDIFITGIRLNQTGWKLEDTWDLMINKIKIINNATIKEIGEHKYFNTYYKVNANSPISFILHNNSGNSRQLMLDIEYLEGTDSTIIRPPKNPDIKDIPNDWDIAVRMQWEEGPADIDLHGIIGNKHVYFGRKEYENIYLNWDYTDHLDNLNPEVLSVKGCKNEILKVYVNNFRGHKLKEPVEIKIYRKNAIESKILKTFKLTIDNDPNILNGICEINLSNYSIKNIENIENKDL
ncbi:hypothetical protein [Clostridium botulinum]|uniref:hypothetical protein n=1 Tax=Clostridium botulinum TaxID=1491 RepID=UPI0004D96F3F|nr:hypothetical protein [Clostridium botulinum]KEH99966.1 hypothetical protein Z952_14695 [Clostridium botulinum C/D str. BKT75002]KEI05688.1 hypothetical protein Z954_14875 [Clostridium botulinum C/D str. BKT2873]MCD3351762.1 hypothetical protein [Clostridium botulinum D/C]MCD3360688.1 hypothetical protein [Clostridium botulinum D/C]MCD3362114.1 hypothetical protein [Clostridium botulinum D/C]